MPFIELDQEELDKVKEPELVEEGEYNLIIGKVEEGPSKKNPERTVLSCIIENQDVPDAAPIFEYISMPAPGDKPETRKMMLLNLRRFCAVFNVPIEGGVNSEDFLGATGRCYVVQKERDDNGEMANNLKLPKLSV